MMRKIYISLLIILSACFHINAQIGVNIENSNINLFYVDPSGNTNNALNTNVIDDFIIDDEGRVGIGVSQDTLQAHDVKLNLAGTFRMSNGARTNRILVSDTQGVAFWRDKAFEPEVRRGVISTTAATLGTRAAPTNITTTNLTLTEGWWIIYVFVGGRHNAAISDGDFLFINDVTGNTSIGTVVTLPEAAGGRLSAMFYQAVVEVRGGNREYSVSAGNDCECLILQAQPNIDDPTDLDAGQYFIGLKVAN